MPKPSFVEVEYPEELQKKALEALEMAKDTGRIKKGINEATKSIERGIARLVLVAGDVEPPEIIMYLPGLCDDKKAPYIFVDSKKDLGNACGIERPTAAVAIVIDGKAKDLVDDLVEKIAGLRK
ncbi:MAG: 50S ribosomal protein L7Ae [Candidatus Thorarchaeota archaeon]|jgi:large subunit ribosomal protein L7Ae|nr:50S ribosomal protein L7Ae [Candidatus Thorarchaeota archaeon]MCK4740477.1 50S ribosomal protein L7Ae [Candidatus Thorarchaeota archaeon]